MTSAHDDADTTDPVPVQAVVDAALRACEAYGRPDLTARVSAARRTLADPAVHVVVVGEFKKGKSSLVNALVNASVCPVDDDVATALPLYVRHGDETAAELLSEGDPPRREPVAVDTVRDLVTEHRFADAEPPETGQSRDSAAPAGVEIRLPRPLLAGGLVLVDTPGVGGLGSTHATASLAAASLADALVFVTDASQELTSAEYEYIRRAYELCPTVVCALTKIDLYPQWRTIRDRNAAHLAALGTDTTILPVSATLRTRALSTEDRALNEESGFPELVRFVRRRVGDDAAARAAQAAASTVVGVCTQLTAQFESERAALADPATAARVVEELTAVKQRVEALQSAAARWSQTLSDGIADLTSDVEFDLRGRLRNLTAEADEAIEAGDPADTWPALRSWLESRVASEMLENYQLLRDRATALSAQVGEHFQQASGEILKQFPVASPAPVASSAQLDDKLDLTGMTVGKQAMVALKSGYGGAVMFVMLGLMTGVSLGPLALGIGLVMGHRGLREEKRRQVAKRRTEARNAVRRYTEQVGFVMGKDSKDTLRRIHRELRDHYTALAEEFHRSNAEALRTAQQAHSRNEADRTQRLKDIDAELTRLRQLRAHAEQHVAAGTAATPATAEGARP